VAPSFTELAQLAAIAAIRTVLNFFLGREIKEQRELVNADQAAADRRVNGQEAGRSGSSSSATAGCLRIPSAMLDQSPELSAAK
jgi:hypothetical protein